MFLVHVVGRARVSIDLFCFSCTYIYVYMSFFVVAVDIVVFVAFYYPGSLRSIRSFLFLYFVKEALALVVGQFIIVLLLLICWCCLHG